MLGEAMSIFARSVLEPLGNSPFRIRVKRSRFSSTVRFRYGLSFPGSVRVPRYSRISSAVRSQTYAFSFFDQADSEFVKLVKVVGGIVKPVLPIEAQPSHILFDRLNIFLFFLCRIGIVESQVAEAVVIFCQSKIEADRLCMSDMEISVRARGENGYALFRQTCSFSCRRQ